MRMKKIFLVLAAMFCVATVSAQNKVVDTITSQKWSVGLRVGSGLQAQAECFYGDKTYFEARFGMAWVSGVTADLTVLHNWNCCNWNWTPNTGTWFLDAGVGLNIGGGAKNAANVYGPSTYSVADEYWGWTWGNNIYYGVAGQVKFGIKFKKVPIRLAIDYTPVLGMHHVYPNAKGKKEIRDANKEWQAAGLDGKFKAKHNTSFYGGGLGNVAVSATWCF